jgi:hypothetical protein
MRFNCLHQKAINLIRQPCPVLSTEKFCSKHADLSNCLVDCEHASICPQQEVAQVSTRVVISFVAFAFGPSLVTDVIHLDEVR